MGSRSTSRHSGPRLRTTLILLAAWWLWMPLGALIIWLVKHEIFGGYGQQDQGYVLFLQSDLFPHGSLAGATRGGDPSLTYQPTVRPGEYPDQVYPESVAVAQVDATTWAAGRGELDNSGFGFGLTSVDTNASNPGEYVLRSDTDGHFYFVTPLTPRNSGSQAVIAYAVERADEVTSGRLNPVSIYVQSDSADPVSMTVLESRMTTYINQVEPSLLTSGNGGALQEIIPYGTGMWRGFVDIGGVTQDYIDMSGNVNVTPRFFWV